MTTRSRVEVGYDRLEMLFVWLSYAAVFAMMALMTTDAFMRYLFNAPVEGVHELTDEFFMPAIVYFGMAHLYRSGHHVRVTLVSDMLSPGTRRLLWMLFDVATAVLFALITWGVGRRTLETWRMNEYSPSPLNYVIWPSFAIVTIGSALLVVRALQSAVQPRPQEKHDALLD